MQQIGQANIDVSGKGGGQVFIRAGQFFMDGGTIFADNTGGNQHGLGIDIDIQGDMRLQNSARITAGAMPELEENTRGGNITIKAGKLELSGLDKEALMSTLDKLKNVSPDILRRVLLSQNYEISEQEATNLWNNFQQVVSEIPNPEHISIVLDKMDKKYTEPMLIFFLDFFNTIGTLNMGKGQAGNIQIETPVLTISEGLIDSTTGGSGNAGNIDIQNAQQITLKNNGFIRAATIQQSPEQGNVGKAGIITINANDNILLDNFSSISVVSISSGDAGDINLTANQLTLSRRGSINGYSRETGKAGSINITANRVLMTNTGKGRGIYTEATNAGGGNITINSSGYLYLIDSHISSSVKSGLKDGGNITITPTFTILDNSQIFAKADEGRGGNIYIPITTKGVYYNDDNGYYRLPYQESSDENPISASSRVGIDGDVNIEPPEENLDEKILRSSKKPLRAEDELKDRCAGLTRDDLSSFTIVIRDVFPESPLNLKTHYLFD
ncbi:filamentous haemagglutinin-like protein [Beggiatoa sp. PS]|nr:filamentous haemagglutinin-like protein [Beggiatoa sp. PS]